MINCLYFAENPTKRKIPRHKVRYKEQCKNEAIFGNKAAQERPMVTTKHWAKVGGPQTKWDGWPAVSKAGQPSSQLWRPKSKSPKCCLKSKSPMKLVLWEKSVDKERELGRAVKCNNGEEFNNKIMECKYYSDHGKVSIANNYSEAQKTEHGEQLKRQGDIDQIKGQMWVLFNIWMAGQPSLRLPSRPT